MNLTKYVKFWLPGGFGIGRRKLLQGWFSGKLLRGWKGQNIGSFVS